MNTEILADASNAVTDRPVTIEVNVDPQSKLHAWLQKCKWTSRFFPKTKVLSIHPIRMGSLIKISKLVLTIDEQTLDKLTKQKEPLQSVSDIHGIIAKHGETLIEIVAMAVHNKESNPPASLARLIRNQFEPKSLLEVLMLVLRMMDTKNFTLSIISIRGLNIMEMNPKTRGSSIAPGTLSEE